MALHTKLKYSWGPDCYKIKLGENRYTVVSHRPYLFREIEFNDTRINNVW